MYSLVVNSHILELSNVCGTQDAIKFCRLLSKLLFIHPMKTSVIFMTDIYFKGTVVTMTIHGLFSLNCPYLYRGPVFSTFLVMTCLS